MRERDEGPAIEHAYAATTYQAQGATVDRAYVAVDPSMDRQEFYVAASRSREETFFYATPEISIREDYAPAERSREGIEHIAEAAKRDGAQVSAHDQALLAKYKDLPAADLYRARDALRSEAMAEGQAERAREQVEKELARSEEWLTEKLPAQAEQAQGLSRRQRKDELSRIEETAEHYGDKRAEQEAERAALAPQSHDARAEVAAVEHLIAERERAAVTAARISPPDYIVRELGQRPSDPAKARTWDRAVNGIESYRLRHGIEDRSSALGKEPTKAAERQDWHAAQRRVRDSQRRLSREAARSVERGVDLGIGR